MKNFLIPLFILSGGLLFGTVRYYAGLPQNDAVISFEIPPIEIISYGGHSSDGHMITSTLKPTGCDTDLVITAFNKCDIPATRTTTNADKSCVDVPGEHPFEKMVIEGRRIAITLNPKCGISAEKLRDVAIQIHRAH